MNIECIKQVIRSSGSPGSNYIEANESLGKKDFQMKIRILSKGIKRECLLVAAVGQYKTMQMFKAEGVSLMNKAVELKKMFSSILNK